MGPSQFRDLTHSYKGKEYIFVDQSKVCPTELQCPNCHSIVNEPLQTSCGHLFCTECYNRLGGDYRTGWGIQCPVCQQQHTTVQDKFNERRVKALQVRCTNYQYGCKWVGNLDAEMQHRMTQNSCHFEEISCPHGCGQTIRRMTQSRHLDKCKMHPHKCEYCNKQGQYSEITSTHLDTCDKYPVPCPNGCKRKVSREIVSGDKLREQTSIMMNVYSEILQAKTKRIAQLAETNKKVKKFLVFALGTIVLFHLHPLYFIPLFIQYFAACV